MERQQREIADKLPQGMWPRNLINRSRPALGNQNTLQTHSHILVRLCWTLGNMCLPLRSVISFFHDEMTHYGFVKIGKFIPNFVNHCQYLISHYMGLTHFLHNVFK
jgi:hypothetical protein